MAGQGAIPRQAGASDAQLQRVRIGSMKHAPADHFADIESLPHRPKA